MLCDMDITLYGSMGKKDGIRYRDFGNPGLFGLLFVVAE
jgi:hypothetical protein